ncbi:MAG TPA: TetR family transcriptional regulator [Solirubrobacteraceae bacterium]|nr:TetR family transcriptional regulator [Solirubrobacteraceae bacterium]
MPAAPHTRRADARRSIASILDAAIEELARDPDASMGAVAGRAGVARATLYAHFPTREALIAEVTDRAIAEASETIAAAAPEEGEPREALARVVAAAWRTLGRYHALVAINSRLSPERLRALHEPVVGRLRPLVERGQKSGAFNADVPADWLLTVALELVHAASREASAGRLPEAAAEPALLAAVAGALSAPATSAGAR